MPTSVIGSPLGANERDECRIDSIAESWSVISSPALGAAARHDKCVARAGYRQVSPRPTKGSMLRATMLFLFIGLAATTSAESQQALPQRFAQQPSITLTQVQHLDREDALESAYTSTRPSLGHGLDAEAAREVSARTVFAIIGVIVVVGGLIALLA